jgi:hypothetical protein
VQVADRVSAHKQPLGDLVNRPMESAIIIVLGSLQVVLHRRGWPVAAEEARSENRRIRWQPKVLTIEATLVLSLIGIRVLAVADYQPEVALAVAQQGGTGSVALGSLIPLLPTILPLAITLISPIVIFLGTFGSPSGAYRLVFLEWLLVLPTLLITPANGRSFLGLFWSGLWTDPILAIGAVLVLLLRISRWRASSFDLPLPGVGLMLLAVIPFFFAAGYRADRHLDIYGELRTPWLPAEEVTLSSGPRFVGYALKDTAQEAIFLVEKGRTITRVKVPEIGRRQICRIGPPQQLPAWHSPEAAPGQLPSCSS